MSDRYTDKFLNAIMYSHTVNLKCELWYGNQLVAPLRLLSGSVTADRTATVRRTANIDIDPNHLNDSAIAPRLNPYGSRIRLFRGVHYPDGSNYTEQVFWGRIDSVDTSIQRVSLRCSDLNADIIDSRFLTTMTPARLPGAPTTVLNCIKALITDVFPTMSFDTTGITATTQKVAVGTSWSQERADALDSLATQLQSVGGTTPQFGCEWYIDHLGVANIHPLPAVALSGAKSVWVIDSGDLGVMVEQVTTLDRAKVFNACTVTGEPIGGVVPATGSYTDTRPSSPVPWGGPFGKVVRFYTGQHLDPNTTASAQALAKTLTLNSVSSVASVEVTCIPNPKIKLGDIVRVYSPTAKVDGNYYVQSFTLPLDPDTAMTMTLNSSLATDTVTGEVIDMPPSVPEGATWESSR